jgi:hypothetical protein
MKDRACRSRDKRAGQTAAGSWRRDHAPWKGAAGGRPRNARPAQTAAGGQRKDCWPMVERSLCYTKQPHIHSIDEVNKDVKRFVPKNAAGLAGIS